MFETMALDLRIKDLGIGRNANNNFVRSCEFKTPIWLPLLHLKEITLLCVIWRFLGSVYVRVMNACGNSIAFFPSPQNLMDLNDSLNYR
jgi:hypothetical protein